MSEFEEINRERILSNIDKLRERFTSIDIPDDIPNDISDKELRDVCFIWCSLALYETENKIKNILRKLQS